jgi:SAM-dependent methyltransferase
MKQKPSSRRRSASGNRTSDKPGDSAAAGRPVELSLVPGLSAIAVEEVKQMIGPLAGMRSEPDAIRGHYRGRLNNLNRLRSIQAAFLVCDYAIPRPKALLGDAQFRDLLAQISLVRRLQPPEAFRSFYLSAAGPDTAVMQRLRAELARHSGLAAADEEGDLQLRLRPAPNSSGWQVLLRLSPRPLATRDWRVCNLAGALNATVAYAMARLNEPRPGDRFLNLACGSGSLLIERGLLAPGAGLIGCDNDPAVLECAAANLAAADVTAELQNWDAGNLPLPDQSIDALSADLPFGHRVGSHRENQELYPRVLAEAARVARPGAVFTLISHEIRLLEGLLAESSAWQIARVLPINLRGLHPRIFVLRRESSAA